MPAAELPPCVFCGKPIGPGEEIAGRAPMAAHAACADAALADDAHWDAISSGGGDVSADEIASADEDGSAGPQAAPRRAAGCLALGWLIVLAGALIAGTALLLGA